ncbi:hypothetical protein PYCC9005_004558 [Savitreella phatthalungensis]
MVTMPQTRSARASREVQDDDFDVDEAHDHEESRMNVATDAEEMNTSQQKRQEKRRVNRIVVRDILINSMLTLCWFGLSMTLSIYNKWMFSDAPHKLPGRPTQNSGPSDGTATLVTREGKGLNFPFPLFSTSIHMLLQFCCAAIVLRVIPRYRKSLDASVSARDYVTKLGPCGAATALDIGFSNASLKTISLAFYTMCKSSSLAFVLLFAFIFRLERPTWHLVGVIGLITVGVVLMVATETRFVLEGFLLIMTAAAMGGLRWSLTQMLLHGNPATRNPFASIYRLAPVMFVCLFILACAMEGPLQFLSANLWHERGILYSVPLLMFPGLLAFGMTASEFALIRRTSVVTLSVAGILKEVLTIGASAVIYGDALTPMNLSGLGITILGIVVYNVFRFAKVRNAVKQNIRQQDQANDGHADEQTPDANRWRDVEAGDDEEDGEYLYDMAPGVVVDPSYTSLVSASGDPYEDEVPEEERIADVHRGRQT